MEREREETPVVINLYCEFIIALVGQDSLALVITHRAKHLGNYRKKKREEKKGKKEKRKKKLKFQCHNITVICH